jgi:hypothetical protein
MLALPRVTPTVPGNLNLKSALSLAVRENPILLEATVVPTPRSLFARGWGRVDVSEAIPDTFCGPSLLRAAFLCPPYRAFFGP